MTELDFLAWNAELLHAFEKRGLEPPIVDKWKSEDATEYILRLHMSTSTLAIGQLDELPDVRNVLAIIHPPTINDNGDVLYWRLGRRSGNEGDSAHRTIEEACDEAAADFAMNGYPKRKRSRRRPKPRGDSALHGTSR